jgi:hypothetical protein
LKYFKFTDRKLNNVSIKDEEITPLELFDNMEENGNRALQLITEINQSARKDKVNFNIELNDIKTWSYLSLYFSEKLRGGVCLDEARKTKNKDLQICAIKHLEKAAEHWQQIVNITSEQYQEVSLLHIRNYKFTWKLFYPQVLKDIEIAKEDLK